MFGDWKPIGVEFLGPGVGVQLVWQLGTTDQYTTWRVIGGHYTPDVVDGEEVRGHTITSGKTYAFGVLETKFQQDLNGDGEIGFAATVIEAAGATTLAHVADAFVFNGLTLKYLGAEVTEGQFGAWKPIGAEQVGSGYRVAWQLGTADQYTIWNVDGAGDYIPGHTITSGET